MLERRPVDYVDLHSHWIAGIDDGPKKAEAGLSMLRRLKMAGFSTVVATPHMRPGMFDNTRATLEEAYARMLPQLTSDCPTVHLSSEHWFDDVVFRRLIDGQAVPYPGGHAALIEFNPDSLPLRVGARMIDLRRSGLVPVIAHPERYRPVWDDDACLDPLLDSGAVLLLDVCALVGKYGRASEKAARKLLDEDAYEAACSDAHRPEDIDEVVRAIAKLEQIVGKEERDRLLSSGPRAILTGKIA
jgi:protein-tyrosine phosphatase